MITFLKYASLAFFFVLMSLAIVINIVLFFEVRDYNKDISNKISQIDIASDVADLPPSDGVIDEELPSPSNEPTVAPTCTQAYKLDIATVEFNCIKFKNIDAQSDYLGLFESETRSNNKIGIIIESTLTSTLPTADLEEVSTSNKNIVLYKSKLSVSTMYVVGTEDNANFALIINFDDRYSSDTTKIIDSVIFNVQQP